MIAFTALAIIQLVASAGSSEIADIIRPYCQVLVYVSVLMICFVSTGLLYKLKKGKKEPSRVRTFRSQEYALFCQRGTQKGCADHLKTAYPCKRLVHINQCPLVRITSDISYQQVSRQIGIHRTLYVGSQILRHVCSAFFTVIRFIPAFFIQTHPSRIVIPHEEHA